MPGFFNLRTASRWQLVIAIVLVAVACLGIFVLSNSDSDSAAIVFDSIRPIENPSDGYVGSESCRSCHQKNYESWHASYHRTMTQAVDSDSVQVKLDNLTVKIQGRRFEFRRNGDDYTVEMPQPGARKERFTRRLALVTGSHHMHVFWYETGNERTLGLLPIVYLLPEKQWAMRHSAFLHPPDAAWGGREELGRWNSTCCRCHTTDPRMRARIDHEKKTAHYDTHVGEFGISCEVCHGPGEQHVKTAKAGENKENRVPLVDPSQIDHRRASQICAQCHSMYAFTPENLEAAFDAGFPYRPGEDLEETSIRRVVRYLTKTDDPVVNHVLKNDDEFHASYIWPDGMLRVIGREFNGLLESACYQRGKMSCLSCHQLHPKDDSRPLSEWANDQLKPGYDGSRACLQCHDEMKDRLTEHTHHAVDSSGSQCMNCHMPHTSYGLLKGVRSHQISSPSLSSELEAGRPVACNLCHLDKTSKWTAQYLSEWYEQPIPELPQSMQTTSQITLHLLTGDAGQRALAAWHLSWPPARKVSGTDWMPPYLLILLNDPYDAVRQIAYRSLRTLPEFQDFEFDVNRMELARRPKLLNELKRWVQESRVDAPTELLFDPNGIFNRTKAFQFLDSRDDREVHLIE